MFMLSECILFLLMIVFPIDFFKWLSILLCFLYALKMKEGYCEMGIIVIADGLLLSDYCIEMGMMLFMIVQCLYHHRMREDFFFYVLLLSFLYPHIFVLGISYAFMSLMNLIFAYQQKHWLFVTIFLLALCDLCVAIQYLFLINLPILWWFYLPSQIYFIKKVSSMKMKPL